MTTVEPLRHAEHVMGTVFSFSVRDRNADGLPAAVARLHQLDAMFSTYRADSPISRLGRREISLDDCDPEVVEVLAVCAEVAEETEGWFTTSVDGRLDPSGWVKGWAIAEAARLLTEGGSKDHCVTGGGDVQTVGESWRIGVADPRYAGRLVTVVAGDDFAVATSGVAERGAHIYDPYRGVPADGLLSMTLVGSAGVGIARVDAWATAAFAMGPELGLEWAGRRSGIEAFAVLPDGELRWTSGFPAVQI